MNDTIAPTQEREAKEGGLITIQSNQGTHTRAKYTSQLHRLYENGLISDVEWYAGIRIASAAQVAGRTGNVKAMDYSRELLNNCRFELHHLSGEDQRKLIEGALKALSRPHWDIIRHVCIEDKAPSSIQVKGIRTKDGMIHLRVGEALQALVRYFKSYAK